MTSHQTKATQLKLDMTSAAMIAGLSHANTWEPACWRAKTRKPELVRRVVLPMKSILVNAFHENMSSTSSFGQKYVMTKIANKPNGILEVISTRVID